MEIGFVALAIMILLTSSLNMVMYSGDEAAVTDARKSFYYVITGGMVVGLADLIVRTFQAGNGSAIVEQAPISTAAGHVIFYFEAILALALIANIVIQSLRLITSQGQEDQTEKARKQLIYGFIGVALMLLINPLLSALVPGSRAGIINEEMIGIANFMLTLFGLMAVVAVVIAGIMLVVSVNESLKDTAKTIIRVTVIASAVVIASYSIVASLITYFS